MHREGGNMNTYSKRPKLMGRLKPETSLGWGVFGACSAWISSPISMQPGNWAQRRRLPRALLMPHVAQHAFQFALVDTKHQQDVALSSIEDVLAFLFTRQAFGNGHGTYQ